MTQTQKLLAPVALLLLTISTNAQSFNHNGKTDWSVAMVESTAIYCFVVSMILIFANPFWNHVVDLSGR